MSNSLAMIVKVTLVALFSAGLVNAQAVPKYVAEGVVVAFQKNNRCPSCEGYKGNFAVAFENWIVLINKWKGEKFEGTGYILVHYQMYNRSLSASEINKKLKFVLRERQEHEQYQDCVGDIAFKKGEDNFLRPAEFSDYELTEPGESENIQADFKKLPCFIVDRLPVVIK